MTSVLQQNIDRVNNEHDLIAKLGVSGVFGSLRNHNGYESRAGISAIQKCLSHKNKVVVEEAVQNLVSLCQRSGLASETAVDYLLAALSTGGGEGADALERGIVDLSWQPDLQGNADAPLWDAHPLSRALSANPAAAAPPLLAAVARLLRVASPALTTHAGRQGLITNTGHQGLITDTGCQGLMADGGRQGLTPDAALTWLRPFLCFALLGGGDGRWASASSMHALLTRLACTRPALWAPLARLLAAHLACARVDTPAHVTALLALLDDVADVAEAGCDDPAGEEVACQLAGALVQLAAELAEGKTFSICEVLRCLNRIAASFPAAVSPFFTPLSALSLTSGTREAADILALLSRVCGTEEGETLEQQTRVLLRAASVQTLALQTGDAPKAWASALLGSLSDAEGSVNDVVSQLGSGKNPQGLEASSSSPYTTSWGIKCGPGRLMAAAETLIAAMWILKNDAGNSIVADPRVWLRDLSATLRASAAAAQSPSAQAAPHAKLLPPPLLLTLAALLAHPNPLVQEEAARAVEAATLAHPLAGIDLLPQLLFQIQACITSMAEPGCPDAKPYARAVLAMLRALPALGRHPAAFPFVAKALNQFSLPGQPNLVRAVALRLSVSAWEAGRRGFPALQAALLGVGRDEDLGLRVSAAAGIRDVCLEDSGKGVQLVRGIQGAISDSHPAVAALGLQALAALCEADELDFYGAWAVVHKTLPDVPAESILAREWVGLLQYGALDADVYPERAAAVVSLIWLATSHANPKVRAAAYRSLAAYSPETLEGIEALRPLCDMAALLLRETDPFAMSACEELVQATLAYEHSQRRRLQAVAGSRRVAGAGVDPGTLHHRLTHSLPKALCSAAAQTPAGSSAGVTLLLWAPPPPPPDATRAAAATAAKQAALAYARKFREAAADLPWSGPAQTLASLHAWEAFVRRWVAAVRASLHDPNQGADNSEVTAAAVRQVWETLKEALHDETAEIAEGAALAAAALTRAALGFGRVPADDVVAALTDATHSRVTGLASAAAIAVALPSSDGESRISVINNLLGLLSAEQGSATLRAATATGIGLACQGLTDHLTGPTNLQGKTLVHVASTLLTHLWQLYPSLRGPISAAADVAPRDWQSMGFFSPAGTHVGAHVTHPDDAELAEGVLAGLALAAPSTAEAGGGPILASLAGEMMGSLEDVITLPNPNEAADPARAVFLLVPALGLAAMRSSSVSSGDLLNWAGVFRDHIARGEGASSSKQALDSAAIALSQTLAGLAGSQTLPDSTMKSAMEGAVGPLVTLATPPNLARGPVRGVAAWALAALLGARLGFQAGPDTTNQAPLLALEGCGPLAKSALKALEDVANDDPDPRARRQAAWAAAAACHSARQAPKEATAAAGASLAALSPDGALRPLIESIVEFDGSLATSSHATRSPPLNAAAAVRCVAAAPRLPSIGWGALLARVFAAYASKRPPHGTTRDASRPGPRVVFPREDVLPREEIVPCGDAWQQDDAEGVCRACLAVAVRHGGTPAHGLGQLLGTQMEVACFGHLEEGLQGFLLENLPGILEALSQKSGSTVLANIGNLVDVASPARRGSLSSQSLALNPVLPGCDLRQNPTAGPPVLEPAWKGLARALAARAPEGATEAVGQLLKRLPLPLGKGEEANGTDRIWEAALACLTHVPQDQLLHLLSGMARTPEVASVGTVVRIRAMERGLLPQSELLPARVACIGDLAEDMPLLAGEIGRATASLDPPAQQQALLETLDAFHVCGNPAAALQLAATMVAFIHARTSGVPALTHVTAQNPTAAVQTLSATLPALLQTPAWQSAVPPLLTRLARMLSAGPPPGSSGVAVREGGRGGATQAACVAAECIVGMRGLVASDAFSYVGDVMLQWSA